MKATSSYNNCVPKRECHYCNETPSSLIQIPTGTLTETITVWIGTLLRGCFFRKLGILPVSGLKLPLTLKDKASHVLTTVSKNSVDVYSVSYLVSPAL